MFTPQNFVQGLKSLNCCIALLINGLLSDLFSPKKRFCQRDCGHYAVVRFYSKCAILTKAREGFNGGGEGKIWLSLLFKESCALTHLSFQYQPVQQVLPPLTCLVPELELYNICP